MAKLRRRRNIKQRQSKRRNGRTAKKQGKERKTHISYDLWEMCEGIHLYSLSTIYAAFETILKIYKVLGKNVSDFENNRLKEEKIQKTKKKSKN